MLHPKASLAPYPIKIPPIIAAIKGNNDRFITEFCLPDKFEAIKAPSNKPILVRETESCKMLL